MTSPRSPIESMADLLGNLKKNKRMTREQMIESLGLNPSHTGNYYSVNRYLAAYERIGVVRMVPNHERTDDGRALQWEALL